ncbi:replication protein A 32 kDa subunit-A-like [Lycodopsis pacificus]
MHSFTLISPQRTTTLQMLPCTVSQLLSAAQDGNDTFAICGWELNRVSVVGIIRGFAPFETNIKFSVDDMTGPPLNVKQWVNAEDCTPMTFTSPGTYVKVTGRLRSFNGQRSLLAVNSRCIEDLNEITSHMLEVVHAHMQLFGKEFDVNMNTTAAPRSERVLKHSGDLKDILPNAHRAFLGQIRLMPHKPQQVKLHHVVQGVYILREKPQTQSSAAPGELKAAVKS